VRSGGTRTSSERHDASLDRKVGDRAGGRRPGSMSLSRSNRRGRRSGPGRCGKPKCPTKEGHRGGERERWSSCGSTAAATEGARDRVVRWGSLSRRAQGVSSQRGPLPSEEGSRAAPDERGSKLSRRKTVTLVGGIDSANCATRRREPTPYEVAAPRRKHGARGSHRSNRPQTGGPPGFILFRSFDRCEPRAPCLRLGAASSFSVGSR
jgi:hypothetical protein